MEFDFSKPISLCHGKVQVIISHLVSAVILILDIIVGIWLCVSLELSFWTLPPVRVASLSSIMLFDFFFWCVCVHMFEHARVFSSFLLLFVLLFIHKHTVVWVRSLIQL